MKGNTLYKRMIVSVLCAAVVLMTLPGAAWAKNDNPGVLPPDSPHYGATYGEWGARWWQWALSQPADGNPVIDPTGADCDSEQSGPVWFLAGAFNRKPLQRTCTIPGGKALFFPVLNLSWFTLLPPPPTKGDEELCLETYPTLEECARQGLKDYLDYLMQRSALHVTVDSVPIDLEITDQVISPYRVTSPEFEVLLPLDNVSGITELLCPLVGDKYDCNPYYDDGVYLMLAPLPAGQHTIHILASNHVNVKYELTVQGGSSASGATSLSLVGADGAQNSTLDNSLFLPFVGARPAAQPSTDSDPCLPGLIPSVKGPDLRICG